ncbi:MAG: DivIVA domain-containing protein [Deltaproteobacteria bacterium]
MKISSDDILRQDFSTKAFGFSKEEVMSFLEIVSAEYEELVSENALLKKQLGEKNTQIQLLDESKAEIKDILNTLRQFSKESLEVAHTNTLLDQQLIKKDEEIIKSISGDVGAELKRLLAGIQSLKELYDARLKEDKLLNKGDLERFVSTVQIIKEQEFKKIEAEAASIVKDAKQRGEEVIKEATSHADKIREQAAPIVHQAKQKAEEVIREALELASRKKEESALLANQTQQRSDEMLRDAERAKESAVSIVAEAHQRADELVREAQRESERVQEDASHIVKKSQQRSELIVQEAEEEASRIRSAFAEIKKQHQFFKDRMKEVIELQLQILGSPGGAGGAGAVLPTPIEDALGKEPSPWMAPSEQRKN